MLVVGSDLQFLYQSPRRGQRDRIHDNDPWIGRAMELAGRTIPEHHAAYYPGRGQLSGCECAGYVRHRGRTAGTANQWRRKHAVYDVDIVVEWQLFFDSHV